MEEDELVARILASLSDHEETARLVAQLDEARRRRRVRPLMIRMVLYAVAVAGGILLGIAVARQIGL